MKVKIFYEDSGKTILSKSEFPEMPTPGDTIRVTLPDGITEGNPDRSIYLVVDRIIWDNDGDAFEKALVVREVNGINGY
ncbi:hypothetical protein A0256_23230 [Mucilaginibacter sp. PAMC 26640]|nr:hypothetical protein A0256_23230 [Mucilaginibacter sp. PAMC 26640]